MDTPVCETEVEIKNEHGFHMRPAMLFVNIANGFDGAVRVACGEKDVDGKSIMQMCELFATVGTKLKIRAEGEGAAELIEALRELIEEKIIDDPPPDEPKS